MPDSSDEAVWLRRRLERERRARLEAETLSERGLRELYERKQQLELLEKIATAANQEATAGDALRLAVTEVCSFTGWEVGHVYRIEEAAGTRHLCSTGIWHGADAAAMAPFRQTTEENRFACGVGLPGRTLATGQAAWIRDVGEDDNFPRGRTARDCGLRAASAFPVLSGVEVVAVLEFFARAAREPDAALLRVMSQIGLQLGRAIERQRHDESVRRRAEELVRARDAAQSASRAKSEFLANTSHELRTPLNAIIGFSELMMNETFGPHSVETYREYSKHIYDSGQHLLAIINDILDLSKIEAGKAELGQVEPIALAWLLREVSKPLCLQAEQKGIAFEIAAEPGLPALIGSERMVRQILINLLSNALKFTPAGGTVAVKAALKASGELVLSVADSGIGMSALEIAVALTPFGQVDSTLSRRHEGTGLGLPLARAMAALHQAELNVTSAPGAGTLIEVVFPRARLRPDEAQAGALAYA
ncbi:MAG TPA: GAF domain-containing sensor histidine kinase [Stellaceae bacterium]|nr:GAF domain-containing sensor histidine kinase [Stellaceae bacterium]